MILFRTWYCNITTTLQLNNYQDTYAFPVLLNESGIIYLRKYNAQYNNTLYYVSFFLCKNIYVLLFFFFISTVMSFHYVIINIFLGTPASTSKLTILVFLIQWHQVKLTWTKKSESRFEHIIFGSKVQRLKTTQLYCINPIILRSTV